MISHSFVESRKVASMSEDMTRPLDALDRNMVEILQRHGRISNANLAIELGVAPSTAHQRMHTLIDGGVITGFRATVDPRRVGLQIQALISVVLRVGARQNLPDFAQGVASLPRVRQVFFLGGNEDFVIHLVCASSDDVRSFVVEHLSSDRLVASTRTSLIFDHIENVVGI